MTEPATIPPVPLARAAVAADDAALSRRLGRGLTLPLLPSVGATLRIAAAPIDAGFGTADPVLLEGPFGALHLADGAAFLRALTGFDVATLDAENSDNADNPARAWLHANLLGRLQGGPFGSVQRIARPATAPAGTVLHLTLAEPGHAVTTPATASAAAWCALLAAAPYRRAKAPAAPFLALATTIPIRIASHRLPFAVLGTLTAGDILLPDTPRVDTAGTGWLDCAGHRAHVRHNGTGTIDILTLEAAMEEQHRGQTPDSGNISENRGQTPDLGNISQSWGLTPVVGVAPVVDGDGDLSAIDGAALRLDFQLGTLALTLGELRTFGPGTVLELAEGGAGAVAILCGGKALGVGEAVDVAGRLGIRITRWDAPC